MACATLRDGKRWTRRVAAGNRRRKTENQSCWTSAWRINTWQLQGVWARVSQACNKSSRQSIFPRSLMATHDPTVSMRPNHADIPNHLFIDSSFTYSAANMFLSPLLPGVRMLLRALTWLLVLPASDPLPVFHACAFFLSLFFSSSLRSDSFSFVSSLVLSISFCFFSSSLSFSRWLSISLCLEISLSLSISFLRPSFSLASCLSFSSSWILEFYLSFYTASSY